MRVWFPVSIGFKLGVVGIRFAPRYVECWLFPLRVRFYFR